MLDGEGQAATTEEEVDGEAADTSEEEEGQPTGEDAGEGSEGEEEDGEDSDGEEEEPFDKERAMATIQAQRAAEAKLKDDLKAARADLRRTRAEVATLKSNSEGEAEELRAENERLQEELSEARGTVETYQSTARRANFLTSIDLPMPDVAYSLAKDMGVEIEWDDNDRPTNLRQVQRALIQAKPQLFGEPSIGAGHRTNGAAGSNDMNELLRTGLGA